MSTRNDTFEDAVSFARQAATFERPGALEPRGMVTAPTVALQPADLAALFDGELLAIARHSEEHFFTGQLATRLAKRASLRAGLFDDDDSSEQEKPYKVTGGVGVLCIDGPLLQHGGWLFDGHEAIRAKGEQMAADPAVKVGAMRIDSPGGVVAGCLDNVRATRDAFARAGKPLLAWCGGNGAFSAAYAWASAASRISVPETGGAGSVGCISKMQDRTKMTADAGLRIDVIRSGDRKAEGDPDIKNTDAAVARQQAVVDDAARVFATVVDESRHMGVDKILGLQGEAFYGSKAVDAGLADAVEDFDTFMGRCGALAEGIAMKSVAARLGLSADAGEGSVLAAVEAIIARESTAKASGEARASSLETKLAEMTKQRDELGASYLDFVCVSALTEGKKTAAQIASDKEIFSALPPHVAAIKARAAYEPLPRGAALPRETPQPTDPPRNQGPSADARKLDPAQLDGAKMSMTQIAQYYGTEHFARLTDEHNRAQAPKDAGMFARVNMGGPGVVPGAMPQPMPALPR